MTFAQRQRAALIDLMAELGPFAPTMAGDWRVQELAAHLYIREHRLDALPGIGLDRFAALTERIQRDELHRRGFTGLLDELQRPGWIMRPLDGHTATVGNGTTTAFEAPDRATVRAWHAAGLAAGAEEVGAPGLRPHYHPDYYGAYLRDPDGHRVEIYTQDYYTGDPDNPVVTWDVHDNQRRDWWGNPVVPSWYTDASLVLDLDGNPQQVVKREETSELEATIGADGFSYTRKGDTDHGFKLGHQL